MPPVSSIWIPGRRWAPALGHPTVRNPAGGHAGNAAAEPAAAAQTVRVQEDTAARSVHLLFRHHAERRER
jgi:hypothetical protein